jgi:omega-hydroxy-beta-dihydromenaquinone-9 sulfotransferase
MTPSVAKHRPKKVQHPLSGSTLSNWLRLLVINQGVSPLYWQRALSITAMILLGAPLRWLETARFGPQIKATPLAEPPIFILGHWRSGTTYLHRLMVQDHQWGYVSSLQAFLPEAFLNAQQTLLSKLQKAWPKVRLMDNVSYSPDVPEEEDYALGNLSPFSFYGCWYFPRNMAECYRRSVLMEGLSTAERQQWEQAFIKILKKATIRFGGKRLIIKNPSNTAKIKILLELFPEAKFIHIFRNPYDVYNSTLGFYEKMLPHYTLQTFDQAQIEHQIFDFYRELMARYFAEFALIPSGNFIEIRYEDFENNEIAYLEKIYQKLELDGFEAAKNNFERYVKAQANYQKNQYDLDAETKAKVYHHWQEAIDRWARVG